MLMFTHEQNGITFEVVSLCTPNTTTQDVLTFLKDALDTPVKELRHTDTILLLDEINEDDDTFTAVIDNNLVCRIVPFCGAKTMYFTLGDFATCYAKAYSQAQGEISHIRIFRNTLLAAQDWVERISDLLSEWTIAKLTVTMPDKAIWSDIIDFDCMELPGDFLNFALEHGASLAIITEAIDTIINRLEEN